MKKLKLLVILSLVVALMGFTTGENDKYIQNVKTLSSDTISPVIKFTDESLTEIVLVEGTVLNLSDWLTVTDNVGVRAVSGFGTIDVDTAGEYTITVMAADAAANITTLDITVKVITTEEYEAILAEAEAEAAAAEAEALAHALQEQQEKYNAALQAIEESLADDVDNTDIYALALTYLGMSGWCNEVATAFLTEYYGTSVNIYNGYVIDASEAQPGDLVEYEDGGKGTWHVAVYLGNGLALHGNWNGTTVIESIYVPGGTLPYFVRLY